VDKLLNYSLIFLLFVIKSTILFSSKSNIWFYLAFKFTKKYLSWWKTTKWFL